MTLDAGYACSICNTNVRQVRSDAAWEAELCDECMIDSLPQLCWECGEPTAGPRPHRCTEPEREPCGCPGWYLDDHGAHQASCTR